MQCILRGYSGLLPSKKDAVSPAAGVFEIGYFKRVEFGS